MSKKFQKKMESPLYENKAVAPLSNKVEVIKAHDGLEVGRTFHANELTIQRMVSLGYWKRV